MLLTVQSRQPSTLRMRPPSLLAYLGGEQVNRLHSLGDKTSRIVRTILLNIYTKRYI